MLKHVGNHNNKKIVILYRQVPGEDHMCLAAYSDLLPRMIHDEVMKCLESPIGQQAKDFADALFRITMADGRNALTTLHQEGFIKKLPTNQVIVTPTASAKVRLDELNNLLSEMEKGEDAIKKLQELDNNKGLKNPTKKVVETVTAPDTSVLTDEMIAKHRLDQAAQMRLNAEGLLAEAARLEAEAQSLVKVTKAPRKNARTTKETPAKKTKVKAD